MATRIKITLKQRSLSGVEGRQSIVSALRLRSATGHAVTKSTFTLLFLVSFLYTCIAQAAELPSSTKAQLHQIIGKLEKAGAQVGLEIDDLGTVKNPQQFPAKSTFPPKVLFSYRATQSYMSASNWKLFTAFYALKGDAYDEVRQSGLFTRERFEGGSVIDGNLYFSGMGDPSLNVEQIRQAALSLKNMGVKEIKGDICGEAWYFAETLGNRYPFGWTLDDALWYYAPPITLLSINRNQVDVTITGGDKPGDPAIVTYSPDLPGVEIESHVVTGTDFLMSKPADELLHWDRFEGDGTHIIVTGYISHNRRITQGVALPNPPLTAAKTLAQELEKVGIKIDGTVKTVDWNEISSKGAYGVVDIPATPLKVLLTRMLKRSDNFYAEMILRTSLNEFGSVDDIRPYFFKVLKENGITTTGLRMEDGSGLSRYSLITPQATVQLLNAAQKLPKDKADIFWNALPIAGLDGTLGERMDTAPAKNNVRAKTGTFSTVCNLSGYVTTRDGHRLAVSFLTNFGPETDVCRAAQNQVFESLAAGTLQ